MTAARFLRSPRPAELPAPLYAVGDTVWAVRDLDRRMLVRAIDHYEVGDVYFCEPDPLHANRSRRGLSPRWFVEADLTAVDPTAGTPEVVPLAADVDRERDRRIGVVAAEAALALTDMAEIGERVAAIVVLINAAAVVLKAMDPVPADYADDRHWRVVS